MVDQIEQIEGGCNCGAIRYVALGPPDQILVCHCHDCRRATGAQSVAWLFLPIQRYEIVRGTPAEHASSEGVIRKFCTNCGTTLTWEGDSQSGRIDVTVGSLDHPECLAPTRAVILDLTFGLSVQDISLGITASAVDFDERSAITAPLPTDYKRPLLGLTARF